jgi:hypothetical protein
VGSAYGHEAAALGILQRAENAFSPDAMAEEAELCIRAELT